MAHRKEIRILACFACLAVVSGPAFGGEDPAQNPAPAPQPTPATSVVRFLSSALAYPLEDITFNLAADTYGNVLGVDIADAEGALRAQLGIDEGVGVIV